MAARRIYAETPAVRTRQLLGDLFVAGWLALWVWIACWLHDLVGRLAAPGRSLEDAGDGLAGALGDASRRVDDVPLAGRALAAPFDAASGAGDALAQAGQSQQDAVGSIALWLAVLVAAGPIVAVLVRWLPDRVRWVREASGAAQLRASAVDLDLFALRALVSVPLSTLAKVDPDPAGAYRRGDTDVIGRLAALELESLGLRSAARTGSGRPR